MLFYANLSFADYCTLYRRSFQNCMGTMRDFFTCSGVGAGYDDCKKMGLSHQQCELAQAGYSDCAMDIGAGSCINALSGYSDCKKDGRLGSEACKRAGLNFLVCSKYSKNLNACLAAPGSNEIFACPL